MEDESISSNSLSADVLKGKNVVVVEDEGITQMMLQRALVHAGMSIVGIAANAQDGIDVVLKEKPDLVLMDINMPGKLTGLDAAESVLKTLRVCIVMVSAYSDGEYLRKAKEIGACGCFSKPIFREAFLLYLQKVFQQWQTAQRI